MNKLMNIFVSFCGWGGGKVALCGVYMHVCAEARLDVREHGSLTTASRAVK